MPTSAFELRTRSCHYSRYCAWNADLLLHRPLEMHIEGRWLRNVPTSPKVCSATSFQPRSRVISLRTGECPHHPRRDAVSSSSLSGIVNRFMHLDADPLHHICPLQLKLGLPCARINGRPHAVLPFLHSYHGLTTITRVSTGICLICCGTCRFIPLRQMNLQTKLRVHPDRNLSFERAGLGAT